MSKLAKFILPAVLVALMVLASSSSVFATTELAYDNGRVGGFGVDWGFGGGQVGVKFQVTPGARLLSIRTAAVGRGICPGCGGATAPVSFTVHILAADGVTPLTTPFPATVTGHGVDAFGDPAIFESIDVTGKNIIITGTEFFVIFASAGSSARLFRDNQAGSGRSYETYNTPIDPNAPASVNMMIRVDVEYLAPVGGVLTPVNKLDVLAPYLALVGLVGAVTAAFAIQRRRKT